MQRLLTPGQGQLLETIKQHSPRGCPEWKLAPELPSGEEVLASAMEVSDLPHNHVGRLWISKDAYLETQYTLLRREGTEGLRHAVNAFRAQPDAGDNDAFCIYKKVCRPPRPLPSPPHRSPFLRSPSSQLRGNSGSRWPPHLGARHRIPHGKTRPNLPSQLLHGECRLPYQVAAVAPPHPRHHHSHFHGGGHVQQDLHGCHRCSASLQGRA